jgi:hypothetical protein
MIKYLKIDLVYGEGASICYNKEEVIEGCGYDPVEMSFEDCLKLVEGIYEIIEIKGEFEMEYIT